MTTIGRNIEKNEKNPERKELEAVMANVLNGHPFENICFYFKGEEGEEKIEIKIER